MRTLLLSLLTINIFLLNASANENFNAYTQDFFIRTEFATTVDEKVRSNWGFTADDLSQNKSKNEVTILVGLEFPISEENNIYSNITTGIRHNGSFNAVLMNGQFVYKKGSWKASIGGYAGFGRDKTGIDGFNLIVDQQAGGAKTIHFTNDTTPNVVLTGFEISGAYIINKRWTIGLKAQWDERQYDLDAKFDHTQLTGVAPGTALNLLASEQSSDNIVAINAVVTLSYSF